MKKRIFSILLALCMVATLLPATVLAASAGSAEETTEHDVSSAAIVSADIVCRTQDLPFSVTTPEGATGVEAGYEFPLSGGPLDEGADGTFLVLAEYYSDSDDSILISAYITTEDGSVLSINKTVAIAAEHIDENDDHNCDICGTTMTAHTGGVANCTEKAVCEICGEEYGELDPDDHTDLTHVEAVAATAEAEGNCEYWYCGDCERYFADESCTDEITLADTVISKLPKADDEAQPPEIIDDDPSPKTGDTAIAIAFATLLLSGSALAGLGVFGKKKQYF